MSLTLPIVWGKYYIRRDGKRVQAVRPPKEWSPRCAVVTEDGKASSGTEMVYLSSGLVFRNNAKDHTNYDDYPTDLIADAPPGHPHADLMMQYAQDALVHEEPHLLWQVKGLSGWYTCEGTPKWLISVEYRRKPAPVKKWVWLNLYMNESGVFSVGASHETKPLAEKESANNTTCVQLLHIEVEVDETN